MDEESLNETLDSSNETADTDTVNEEVVADTTTEDVEALKEKNRKLFVRAKTAEGFVLKDGHWVKKEQKPVQAVNQPQSQPDLTDELRLIARGLSDEDIDQAKVIAKGRGIQLTEALKDPLFTAYKTAQEEQAKKDGSKLGASHGSGQPDEHPFVKSGMSTEDHKKVWRESLGK